MTRAELDRLERLPPTAQLAVLLRLTDALHALALDTTTAWLTVTGRREAVPEEAHDRAIAQ
jgi:hypothetical protein